MKFLILVTLLAIGCLDATKTENDTKPYPFPKGTSTLWYKCKPDQIEWDGKVDSINQKDIQGWSILAIALFPEWAIMQEEVLTK